MTSLEGWSSTIELRPQRPRQGAAVTGSVPSPARRHVQAGRITVARPTAVTCAGTASTRSRALAYYLTFITRAGSLGRIAVSCSFAGGGQRICALSGGS